MRGTATSQENLQRAPPFGFTRFQYLNSTQSTRGVRSRHPPFGCIFKCAPIEPNQKRTFYKSLVLRGGLGQQLFGWHTL